MVRWQPARRRWLEIASRLGFTLLDTGAIYRSLALVARARGVSQDDEEGLAELARDLGVSFEWRDGQNHVFVDGVDVTVEIRLPEVSQAASIVSALPGVRQALLDRQRQLAAEGSVVAEGRDTGTVVFPDAEAKFFVTADDLVRAERRQRELLEKGGSDTLEEVLAALKERDLRDSTRAVAPLKPASDARIIDTTGRTIEEVLAEILEYIAA
jgi:cytidylate kinase